MKLFKFFTLLLLFAELFSYSQSKYGTGQDSISCLENLSLYQEFYKQKNYKDSYKPWKNAVSICPQASKNLYIHGEKIMEYKLKNEKDPAAKGKLLDTLMSMYDTRTQYFGQEGYVAGKKGIDLYQFSETDNLEEVYSLLSKALTLEGNKTSAPVISTYFIVSVKMLEIGKLDEASVLDNYNQSMKIINTYLQSEGKYVDYYLTAKDNANATLESCPCAKCETLAPIFDKDFNNIKTDSESLDSKLRLLDKLKCDDYEIYFKMAEALHSLQPSSTSAYSLAKLAVKNKNYSKAKDFYKQAIELEELDIAKADYYVELGNLFFTYYKSYEQARVYFLKAASLKSAWGLPYELIGDMYVASALDCGKGDNTGFKTSAVYWVAVDMYSKAKSLDGSASSKVNTYSGYFPKKEDAFFNGFQEGESYTIECWISLTTTVRFKSES